MREMGSEQVRAAVAEAVAVLRTAVDRDWETPRAGRLEWNVRYTAEHVAGDLIAYAGQLTSGAQHAYVPFELTLDEGTGNADVLDVVEATGGLLAAAVATTPPGVRAFHPYPFRAADREGFAATGVAEVLLHTHDMAVGLGIAYEPPAELCEDLLTRIFPHVRPGPAPWPTLLWATGRGDLPGRAPVSGWRWCNNPAVPAERLTLTGVTPAAAYDLRAGGDGGFRWIEGGPFEGTREAAGMVVKAYESGVHRPEWGMFVLVRNDDGRALGGIGFHGAPDDEGRAEVGYDLAVNARGHGYATEALRTLAAWTFARAAAAADADTRVTELFAVIDRTNVASQGVITRAGFTPAGAEGAGGTDGGGETTTAYVLRPDGDLV
ncbi:GNAT family N-acetyltransferase [Streptomyces sp. NPDC008150]|uniref:GNAT family N-acetyltransferase n=1 Tax=Streptomyces sp. NPDC008150 TaxID=3364816 RepID=UPI0036E533DC